MRKQIVSREQAIELLFECVDVNSWDHETMVMFIEDHLQEAYQKLTDEQLTKELASEWEVRYQTKEKEQSPYIVDESPTAQVFSN